VTLQEQLSHYGKLPLPLEPELGRCSLTVGDILALAPGSLIKLSRPLRTDVRLVWTPKIIADQPTVQDIGIDPALCLAIADVQDRAAVR